jgi:chromosome segregation ATPase
MKGESLFQSTITAVVCILWGPSLWAQPVEYDQLIKDYNRQYDHVVENQQKWQSTLTESRAEVSATMAAYNEMKELVNQATQILKAIEMDFETQQGHLEFLRQVEPTARQAQLATKTSAVNSGEFGAVNQVTTQSLQQRSNDLQNQITNLNTEISNLEAEIFSIKNSPTWIALVSDRDAYRSRLRQAQTDRSNAENRLNSLRWELRDLNNRFERSVRREAEARQEADRIRNRRIPRLRSEIQGLRDQNQQRLGQRETLLSEREQVTQRRDRNRQRRRELENQLASATDDQKPSIQAELDDVKQRLSRQNRRIDELTSQIQGLTQQIQAARREIEQKQNNIERLRQTAQRKDQEVRDEQIRQVRLDNAMDDTRANIRTTENRIVVLDDQIRNLNFELNQAQQALNQFYNSNVKPLEDNITLLQGQISGLSARSRQLLTWKSELERQEANIAEASRRIPDQEQMVAEASERLVNAQANLEQLSAASDQRKSLTNEKIRSYNTLLTSVQEQIQQFRANEAMILEIKLGQKEGEE